MSLVWNPEIPTQFMVANDDDTLPTLNIWDLRHTAYPVATFNDIHYKGILGISWCLADSNLVASSAKDNRTVVVNFKTGEQVLNFPTEESYSQLRWSNNLKGKLCAMNEKGNASILSYSPEGLLSNPSKEDKVAQVQSTYAPKWYQPCCGVRFGHGNKLVSFGKTKGKTLTIHQKPVNP